MNRKKILIQKTQMSAFIPPLVSVKSLQPKAKNLCPLFVCFHDRWSILISNSQKWESAKVKTETSALRADPITDQQGAQTSVYLSKTKFEL